MIELWAIVCFTACQEIRYQNDESNVQACFMQAQQELAKWTEAHPGWIVRRWGCRVAGKTGKA